MSKDEGVALPEGPVAELADVPREVSGIHNARPPIGDGPILGNVLDPCQGVTTADLTFVGPQHSTVCSVGGTAEVTSVNHVDTVTTNSSATVITPFDATFTPHECSVQVRFSVWNSHGDGALGWGVGKSCRNLTEMITGVKGLRCERVQGRRGKGVMEVTRAHTCS